MPSTTRPSEAFADDLDDVMAPEMTTEEAARARPISEAPAGLQAALPKNKGGRPRVANPKEQVSLRLDPDILEAYRATGTGWQTLVNETLRRGLPNVTAFVERAQQSPRSPKLAPAVLKTEAGGKRSGGGVYAEVGPRGPSKRPKQERA